MNLDQNPLGRQLLIVIWTLWAVSTITLILRFYVRIRLRTYWWDDGILFFTYIVYSAGTGITQWLVALGYGSWMVDLGAFNLNTLDILVRLLYILAGSAITFSKLAFGFTLLRVLPPDNWRRLTAVLSASLILVIIPTFPIVFLQCFPIPVPRNDPKHCISKPVLEYFIGAFSICQAIADFGFAIVAIRTLSGLTIRRLEKLGLMVAMSLGVSAGVLAIAKAVLTMQIVGSFAPQRAVRLSMIGAAEIATAIVAASIPVLRVLYRRGFRLRERITGTTAPSGIHPATIGSDNKRTYVRAHASLSEDQEAVILATRSSDGAIRASYQADIESHFVRQPSSLREL